MVVFYTAFLLAYMVFLIIRSIFYPKKDLLVLNTLSMLMYLPLIGRVLGYW